jgi:hypothetical protein
VAAGIEEPPATQLTRFILESSRITSGKVNHRAFMPPRDLELSTYNIDDLTPDDIWRIADAVRGAQAKASLHGRADLLAQDVQAVGLRPVRDDQPPRHVVIVGWTDDKVQQKQKAQLLAAAAAFVPR